MTSTETVVRILPSKNPSPGPGSYSVPSDFGNRAPKISIKNKYETKDRTVGSPYQMVPSTIGTGKKYSISSRIDVRTYVETPGPDYVPPQFGAEAPKCYFHIRNSVGVVKKSDIPGPGAYVTEKQFGKDGKKFSIQNRAFVKEEGEIPGPGVGKLLPDYSKVLKKPPQTSIGNRYQKNKQAETLPGPADYDIPRRLSTTSSSLHGVSRKPKTEISPGPAQYVPPTLFGNNAPKYSIRSKSEMKREIVDPPIQKLPDTFGKGPQISFHTKPISREAPETLPGPDYVPPPFGNGAPKWSLTSRHPPKSSLSSTPGPAAYDNTIMNSGRSYTIKGRNYPPPETKSPGGPGPAGYTPEYRRVLPSTPQTSIQNRYNEKSDKGGLGYFDLGSTLKGPKFTIGSKENVEIAVGKP